VHLTHLTCTLCGKLHDSTIAQNVSSCCSKPLFAQYDLAAAARTLTKASLLARPKSLWRYREVLPVKSDADIVTLGEGFTPLLPAPRLGAKHGMRSLYIKDEAQNPTGSSRRAA
jgi:threonine synthase